MAMPPDLLEALRKDIAYALAHRPERDSSGYA
jgi:hypothetical protein